MRSRERDLEQLRGRLEHAVAEDTRRQERERALLATPLRRGAVSRDNPLLEVATAQKGRLLELEGEVLAGHAFGDGSSPKEHSFLHQEFF